MMRKAVAGILAVAVLLVAHGPAFAYYEVSGLFVADAECPAVTSIRKETNPGSVLTVAGQSYTVQALNKENGDHAYVEVPGASPTLRWVDMACGALYLSEEEERPEPEEPLVVGGFKPFFDAEASGAGDMTPPPPTLDAFDRAVLRVCGGWGSKPSRHAFRDMLDDPSLSADVQALYKALDGAVLDMRVSLEQFKDDLTEVWFAQGGFVHVFCGEPSGRTIGGLHFMGRYLEMQERGWGGLVPANRCRQTEIAPPIYTLGVSYRTPDGGVGDACPKGYALHQSAREILAEATRAFKGMRGRNPGKAMCLAKVKDGAAEYLAVFVIKSGAVRTFYPDASPSCDNRQPAAACMCP
jgi:hypothetical protein